MLKKNRVVVFHISEGVLNDLNNLLRGKEEKGAYLYWKERYPYLTINVETRLDDLKDFSVQSMEYHNLKG